MNLLTLLGAAIGSEEFCGLLRNNPVEAARLLNITLTEAERDQLIDTFTGENSEELWSSLPGIRKLLCKKPPCRAYVVIPDQPDVDRKAA